MAVPIINSVTVNSRINPTNVENAVPLFVWNYSDTEDDSLAAYQIQVSTNSDFSVTGDFVWDSGEIVSANSFSALYDGSTLLADTVYYFRVKVADESGYSDWATGNFKLNSIPIVSSIVLQPRIFSDPDYIGYCNQDLSVSYVYSDDEPESHKTEIKWFNLTPGGSWTQIKSLNNFKKVLASCGSFVPGDKWKASVRPHDGVAYGSVVESNEITYENRKPVISSAFILPGFPKTSSYLEARVETYDADDNAVSVSIKWFKNGDEVKDLRNAKKVPPFMTGFGDLWHFEATPFDGYEYGSSIFSKAVEIEDVAPKIISFLVDGYVAPVKLRNQSPNFSWVYQDDDLRDQLKYQFIIGTKEVKTSGKQKSFKKNERGGIVKVSSSEGELLFGNDIYDSGIMNSSSSEYQYLTFRQVGSVGFKANDFVNLRNYYFDHKSSMLVLRQGVSDGTASLVFNGASALYNISIEIEKDLVPSSYNLLINGSLVGNFSSELGIGTQNHLFKAVKINKGDLVSVLGISTLNSKAKIKTLSLSPIPQFEIDRYDSISGYSYDETGIRLSALIGTAIYKFPHYSGLYDIEVVYETETTGGQTLGLYRNTDLIGTITYSDSGKIESKVFQNIEINKSDILKAVGTRTTETGLVRVNEVKFRPISTDETAGLKNGGFYHAAVRVFNGRSWSAWHSTIFSINGSAWDWASNERGWTIETRVSVN